MIEQLVPDFVAAVETTADVGSDQLFPSETDVISNAVTKRRIEFGAVRWCARQALAELGIGPVPILPGERGAPQWPLGVVGSMTHCTGYRAAVVARSDRLRGLGIDAEPNEPLPAGVLAVISRPEERDHLAELTRTRPGHWDRLLFTIKESVYKTWFPLTARWLDFTEASVRIDPIARTFEVRLLADPAAADLTALAGRFGWDDAIVASAIAVPS